MVGLSTSLNGRRGFERKAASLVFITLKPALRNTPRAKCLDFDEFGCIFVVGIGDQYVLQIN